MTKQIEIEFKNILTKKQYDDLLKAFQINVEQIHRQANHYFDTTDFQLKQLMSGLRIRQKKQHFECTLKEKSAEHTHIETTDIITEQQANEMLQGEQWHAPAVHKRLVDLNINTENLQLFGSLVTDRVEFTYKGGLLVFDHSLYLQQEDYEVEYETDDATTGYAIFQQFLQEHHIEQQTTDKKIARFMKALANQQ